MAEAIPGLPLSDLVEQGLARAVVGDDQVRISGVRHDSRAVEPGDLFVAIQGQVFDGRDYSQDAVGRGAAAVAAEAELDLAVPVLLVDNALSSLWKLSRYVYDDPTAHLPVVGVTGTNGKSTVACMVEQLLLGLGQAPALLGTIENRGPGGVLPATHTTPMADDLMRLARWALETGASHLVFEVSSHALAMERTDGVHFRIAAFTNLTQDHLDYHGDMASYGAAKGRLFRELSPSVAVINVDDPFGRELASELRAAGRACTRCSRTGDHEAELRVLSHRADRSGLQARVETPEGQVELKSSLLGLHNLDNLLLALGCGLALDHSAGDVAEALSHASGAPGRLERIEHPEDVLVFVDYAHTPDALARVCRAVRDATDGGRLLLVFGCGGDRDRGKRPMMGRAAAEHADVLVVTSDNPRSEDPEAIIDDILPGLVEAGGPLLSAGALSGAPSGHIAVPDREQAITLAVGAARPGDAVLIAGKGHESYQLIGDERLPFDDRQQARSAIAALGKGA